MRGFTAKTPELVAEALRMRDEGHLLREIAHSMGVSLKTIHGWLSDPDGAKLAARKDSYRGTCEDCGVATHGGYGPGKAPAYCIRCSPAHRETKWDAERCIAAIRWWADQYGEAPAVADFNPYQARVMGNEVRAARSEALIAAGRIPQHVTVYLWCGSWNAAMEAAGFTPRAVGGGDGNQYRRRTTRTRAAA